MSTFGGDSWAREAQQRKRRVDDLMLPSSSGDDSSPSFKMLSSGKYACLVCPHSPILDTPLMLSIHNKGSRHVAAESRVREKELLKRAELHKRIALSGDSSGFPSSGSSTQQVKHLGHSNKPLIQKTMKVILEAQNNVGNQGVVNANHDSKIISQCPSKLFPADGVGELPCDDSCRTSLSSEKNSLMTGAADHKMLSDWHSELRRRREKELKFTAAGWKRDCHGKWYRDENVEFDSDEEDPNITLR